MQSTRRPIFGKPGPLAMVLGVLGAVGAGCDGQSGDDGSDMAAGTGGQLSTVSCTITPTLTMSPVISTVASVEFTTDLAAIDGARIEFGPDTSYGMQAQVDLAEPGYRTVLLGMKPSSEYHYRVVATAGGQMCVGDDNTLQTGVPPNQPRLIGIDIETPQPEKLAGGYLVGGIFMSGPAFILDADGDYVWWYDAGDVGRARMSYDGKYMWIRNTNVNGGNSLIQRVSMDGTQVETFDGNSAYGDGHHDFTVLPDGSMVLIQHDGADCDTIVEVSPDGTAHDIISASEAHGGTTCHVNSVHYLAEDDTITFSDLEHNCYVKVTRSGEVVWILGGEASTFTSGSGLGWERQHGHHVLSPQHMLMFENGPVGGVSVAHELMLDPAMGIADEVWRYDAGLSTIVMGDVQRLPNGNTMVTFTTSGTIHEVDQDGNLIRSLGFQLGGAVSYVQWRESLYGPPPR